MCHYQCVENAIQYFQYAFWFSYHNALCLSVVTVSLDTTDILWSYFSSIILQTMLFVSHMVTLNPQHGIKKIGLNLTYCFQILLSQICSWLTLGRWFFCCNLCKPIIFVRYQRRLRRSIELFWMDQFFLYRNHIWKPYWILKDFGSIWRLQFHI